jgi:hypothetical protein
MDVGVALVANLEATEAVEPGQCPLDDPAILPQSLTRLDATPCDARNDATSSQCLPTARIIVTLIGVEIHRTFAWSPTTLARQTQRRDGVDRLFEPLRVMHIGPRQRHGQWHAVAVHHQVPLGPQFATIRRILAGVFAPPGAGTLALSSDARSQSMRPACCSRCRSARCKRLHTPARCQSRKRRQQVMPLPQPNSWGSISQGIPLFKTNTMPVNAARSVMLRGRPPLGLGGSGGKSGAMIVHSASLISGVLMLLIYHAA